MVKIVSLSDDVYEELAKRKDGKSFSEEIRELLSKSAEKKGDLKTVEKFFGVLDKRDADELEKKSKEFRRRFKARALEQL